MGELTLSYSGRTSLGVPNAYVDQAGQYAASVKGPAFALMGAIPAGNFEFNARLGLLFATTEISTSARGSVVFPPFPTQTYNDSSSDSASTTETLYGLGMGYTFRDHFHIRVDWMMVPDAGDDEETGAGDVELLTAGFQYRF
jgi:hypothetical protein